MGPSLIAVIIILVIILLTFIRNIRVVPQAHTYVIERLGTYKTTWQAGLHAKMPFIDKVVRRVSLKEKVADFPPQAVITKDNVTMEIDTVIFYQVVDSKLYSYGIENPIAAIENLSATTLRNVIGDLELDETLTSRDHINSTMRTILDEATDPWGIRVNRVELKNIIPPKEIQDAMEKQMKAERVKREQILLAEGKKEAAILVAEGEKEAEILRADAKKQRDILEAQGKAEAILEVQHATAEGLKMIKDVQPDDGLISLKALDTMAAVADGKATKIIIPSEMQSLAGLAVSLKEFVTDPQKVLPEADQSAPSPAPAAPTRRLPEDLHDSRMI
ncbi:MAG: SPFH domain-containing protein [Eubacteriales bacterium]|nr:SPFH/Band 7/PHB domain protein [Clostridiales bacterium]MDY5835944.1 SPFH domain-containing protein [Eubacteriales bacterium]